MRYGLDYLAGARYSDLILREHPEGWAAGFFANTFGNALPTVERLLATGRCPHVRIQLLWSDSHTFGDGDIPTIRRLARAYQALKGKYPSVTIELSPFCEHNLQNPDKYLEIVKNEAPDCVPVNVPWRGAFSKRFKNEIHGDHSKPQGAYNYSLDGMNGPDANITALKNAHASADVFFFWGIRMNGNYHMGAKVARPDRKGWPDSRYIDSLIALHKDKGQTNLPRGWLFKSHAENKGTGDPRAEKPVWVVPVKARAIELRADNGQVIDSAKYYGPFADGRHRYYCSDWGFLLAEKARRIHGHPRANVFVNGKRIGIIHPSFREGSWR